MSSLARIFGVFSSPGRTMADIVRAPHFLLCWCVQVAVGMGYFYYVLQRVGVYELVRQSIVGSARGRAMDAATLQTAVNTAAKFFPYGVWFVPVGTIAVMLLLGWVFQGVANFLLGYEANYKPAMAMVSHAYLPQTLLAIVGALVVTLMPDPTKYQLQNPLGSNLAFFLDKSNTSPFLYSMAGHMDLFVLWSLALLSLGLAKLGGKKGKFSTALGAVIILWLFYCLASAGMAAAFS